MSVHFRPNAAGYASGTNMQIRRYQVTNKYPPLANNYLWEKIMGRGILLLLLGVPLPIVILLALFWH